MRISPIPAAALIMALGAATPAPAFSWGDKGHEVIALVAQAFLDADVASMISHAPSADH